MRDKGVNIFKAVAEKRNMSGYTMARQLGLSDAVVYRYLRGRGWPASPVLLYQLYKISGLGAKEFLELLRD